MKATTKTKKVQESAHALDGVLDSATHARVPLLLWGPPGVGKSAAVTAWARRRGETLLPHAPGGGDIALRATDHMRFLYAILKKGRWEKQQLIPADYIELCGKPTKWNTHAPMSLMFELNADGHVAGAPRDAFFKSGGGGFGVIVIPSLDMVIYKMSGDDSQYNPARTGLKQDYAYDGSREGWKPAARSQFSDGPIGTDDGVRRVLEMVAAAVID